MRPGQTAPECENVRAIRGEGTAVASMRPGQTAPECRRRPDAVRNLLGGFNEAGADCPGMPVGAADRLVIYAVRFNEAGADCPGMLAGRRILDPRHAALQ